MLAAALMKRPSVTPTRRSPPRGRFSVSGDTDSDNLGDVFVQTFDQTGAMPTDSPFHLYLSCP